MVEKCTEVLEATIEKKNEVKFFFALSIEEKIFGRETDSIKLAMKN